MQAIEPIRITAGNFAAYGRYYNLRGEDGVRLADGQMFVSRERISGEPLKIGATAVAGGPFVSSKMERHVLSEELLICGDGEMILTVADSDPEEAPRSRDVRAFIMRPGDAVVLGRGIWHDANHGLRRDTTYFFLIPQRDFVASEVKWTEIVPEAVPVRWETGERGEPEAAAPESGEPQAAVPETQTRPGAPEADRLLNGADGTPFLTYGRLVRVLEGPGLAGDTGWRSWLEEMPALTEGCYLGVGFPEDDSWDSATECGPAAISRDGAVECGSAAISRDGAVECGSAAIFRDGAVESGPAAISRDSATESGPAAISRDSDTESGPAAARQILCACGAVNLTVKLREQPESVHTVKLSQGDYALLEENVCYKVLREPGTAGYFYILSPVGCV